MTGKILWEVTHEDTHAHNQLKNLKLSNDPHAKAANWVQVQYQINYPNETKEKSKSVILNAFKRNVSFFFRRKTFL